SAVRQWRRSVTLAFRIHATGGPPGSSRRVITFRACKIIEGECNTAGHEHSAIRQASRGLADASDGHAAGQTPSPSGRVIKLRARQITLGGAAGYQHLAIREQSRTRSSPSHIKTPSK